jgi:hypothetical protein
MCQSHQGTMVVNLFYFWYINFTWAFKDLWQIWGHFVKPCKLTNLFLYSKSNYQVQTNCPPLELEGGLQGNILLRVEIACKIQLICSIALVLFRIRASPPTPPIWVFMNVYHIQHSVNYLDTRKSAKMDHIKWENLNVTTWGQSLWLANEKNSDFLKTVLYPGQPLFVCEIFDFLCCKFNDFLSKSPNFDKYSFFKILNHHFFRS